MRDGPMPRHPPPGDAAAPRVCHWAPSAMAPRTSSSLRGTACPWALLPTPAPMGSASASAQHRFRAVPPRPLQSPADGILCEAPYARRPAGRWHTRVFWALPCRLQIWGRGGGSLVMFVYVCHRRPWVLAPFRSHTKAVLAPTLNVWEFVQPYWVLIGEKGTFSDFLNASYMVLCIRVRFLDI